MSDMVHSAELGEVVAQSKANANQINRLEDGLVKLTSVVSDGFLAVSKQQAPNITTMLTFAAVIIAFMTAVLAPVGFFAIREWDRSEKTTAALETRYNMAVQAARDEAKDKATALEKQVQAARDEAKDTVKALDVSITEIRVNGSPVTRERLTHLEARQEILWDLRADQIKRDLDELQQRRAKDVR